MVKVHEYIREQKNKLQILKNNPLLKQQCDVREMCYEYRTIAKYNNKFPSL